MTDPITDAARVLADIRERAEKAADELGRLCQDRANWRWSIPANPKRDSDLIIAASQADVSRLVKAVEIVLIHADSAAVAQIDTDYDRGYAAAMASARGLIEAGLLAAPSVVQGGPSLGADHLVAAHLRADERLQGIPIFVSDGTECLIPPADERHAAPQAPADPPAGVESGQDGSGAVRGVVEDRMRALAADMDRDTPLTAEILRQFADEVTHLRAAGDRAIQSIVSRLPEADDPTTPEGQ